MTQVQIPGGDAGTQMTLMYMTKLATAGAVTSAIRDVAASLVQGTGRDPVLHGHLIAQWVEQHTEFLPDPSVAEALLPPDQAIGIIHQRGVVQCDCDDVAMLAASLGLSIGLRARFVVVAFGTDPTAPYAHVWAELAPPSGGGWLTIDPTRPTTSLPHVSRSLVWEV